MFRRSSLGVLLSVILFVGAGFAVRWVVMTQRAPGAITVVEAQAMDMNAMTAPEGTQAVSVVPASNRVVASSQTFPATAAAFSDEEVVARVPGRLVWTAYPGDQIKAGQIVAKVEANEYDAQNGRAKAMVSERQAMSSVAQDEAGRSESAHDRSIAEIRAAQAIVETAEANLQAAGGDQGARIQIASAKAAAIADAKAQEEYLAKAESREKELYSEGITSLDRYQRSQAAAKSAAAKVASAQADATAAQADIAVAAAKVQAAKKEVSEAQARLTSAKSEEVEAVKSIAKAKDEVKARQAEARAEERSAEETSVTSGYRELRALNSAMVADRMVSPGSIVTAGQKLLMLHVADPIRMQAGVPQGLAASIHVGSPVVIAIGTETRHAKVTSVFPQADPSTRTFTVEALVTNHDHAILPGVFGSMRIETAEPMEGVAMPSTAIQTDASGSKFVWTPVNKPTVGAKVDWTCPMHTEVSLPEPGKCPICGMPLVQRFKGGSVVASRRAIETGSSDTGYTLVTKGLTVGDRVIVQGYENLVEGSPIKVEVAPSQGSSQRAGSSGSKAIMAKSARLWTCPMHKQVVEDHPGKCPICGMELVLKKVGK